MFEINLQNIDAATENLFEQIEGWQVILSEMNECLSEVKDMSSLWQETRQLKKCVELVREEINHLPQYNEALVKIIKRYERSDETGADYAESILRDYMVSTFSEIKVPQYEDGIIRI